MSLKFFIFSAVLAFAQAGVLTPVTYLHKTSSYPQVDAVASTHESVVRSFDGTVSHHSKAVDTPFSSVRKTDTRVNNNVYTPAVAKTVTYAAPLTNTVYSHAAPAVLHKTLYTKTASAPAPVIYAAPSHLQYEKYAPADLYTHATPTVTKTLTTGPVAAAATYSHNDAAVSAYGSSQTVHYSPANMVSHMSFDGFGTHWGF